MSEAAYYIAEYGVPIARWMNLSNAITLLQALCEKYWQDPSVCYTIAREPYKAEYVGEEVSEDVRDTE